MQVLMRKKPAEYILNVKHDENELVKSLKTEAV